MTFEGKNASVQMLRRCWVVTLVLTLCVLLGLELAFTAREAPKRRLVRSASPRLALSVSPAAHTAARFQQLANAVRATGLANLSATIGGQDLLVTFGSAGLAPFVFNWVALLREQGAFAILVGALDEALYAACDAAGVPVVRIGAERGRGLGGSASGYFRKDYGAFKRMGQTKANFLVRLLDAAPQG